MTKNNIRKRPNKSLMLSTGKYKNTLARRYAPGGLIDYNGAEKGLGWGQASGEAAKEAFSAGNVGGTVSGILGGVGELATGAIDLYNKTSQIDTAEDEKAQMEEVASLDFSGATDNSSLLSSYNDMQLADTGYNWKDFTQSGGQQAGNIITGTLQATAQGAQAGAALGPWGMVGGAAVGLLSSLGAGLGGLFTGNKKAKEQAAKMNAYAEEVNTRATNSFNSQAEKLRTIDFNNRMANIAAKGGPLKTPYASSLGYDEIDFGGGEPFTIPEGYSYLTIPGTNRLKMRAALSTGESPYLDSWNKARYSTGRFNDQLGNGNMEMQKANRDSAVFSFSPDKNYDYDPLTGEARVGYFNVARNSGWVGNEYYTRPTLDIHEKAHASRAIPQMGVIQKILGDSYTDKYWDDPDEVYSRLMEIRQAHNLDPSKTYNKDDVKDLKKKGFQNNFLDRYDNNTLVRLLNDVANNSNMDYTNYAKDGGKIHIKPSKRGTFTAAAKKHGKSVQAFASQVLANKENYSPAMVKKANFAKNAASWEHGEGGNLYSNVPDSQTHGTDFSNGMTLINRGGTHEQNPFEGVQMGVDPQGIPNLVEEGEVIFNDYVFSNRLHPSEKELEKANLPKRYKGHTFALIAEDMGKESSERPNDPISRRGLEDSMMKLAMVQEAQRARKGKKGTQQLMAYGGRKYDDETSFPWTGAMMDDGNFVFNNPYNYTFTNRRPSWGYHVPRISPTIDIAPYSTLISMIQSDNQEKAERKSALPQSLRDRASSIMEDISNLDMNSTPAETSSTTSASTPSLPTWMRYSPVVGSLANSIYSLIQKPDYENADIVMNEAENLSRPSVRYRALNNYLTYKPLDRNYYLNQLKGQAGATRRAIANSTGNAGTAMAGLLAADYNAQNAVGNTLMQMEQYNDAQRQRVAEFNRGTDMANSQGFMQADQANAQTAQNRDRLRSTLMTQAAHMREASDAALEASRSANLTNFFDNMGGIGQDNMAQNWRNRLIDVGYFGAGSDRVVRKNGGKMLTKKNRRRK